MHIKPKLKKLTLLNLAMFALGEPNEPTDLAKPTLMKFYTSVSYFIKNLPKSISIREVLVICIHLNMVWILPLSLNLTERKEDDQRKEKSGTANMGRWRASTERCGWAHPSSPLCDVNRNAAPGKATESLALELDGTGGCCLFFFFFRSVFADCGMIVAVGKCRVAVCAHMMMTDAFTKRKQNG